MTQRHRYNTLPPLGLWSQRGLCVGQPPELWDDGAEDLDYARDTCLRCPVRRECLADAMAVEQGQAASERGMIRGALDPEQRVALERMEAA